jgi:hypothetical protein
MPSFCDEPRLQENDIGLFAPTALALRVVSASAFLPACPVRHSHRAFGRVRVVSSSAKKRERTAPVVEKRKELSRVERRGSKWSIVYDE